MKNIPFLSALFVLIFTIHMQEIKATTMDEWSNDTTLVNPTSEFAFEDLKIGMTRKEALETNVLSETFDNAGECAYANRNVIVALKLKYGIALLREVEVVFKNEILSEIYLYSDEMKAKKMNKLINDCDSLNKRFTKIYDLPINLNRDISAQNFVHKKRIEYASYLHGENSVHIGIEESNRKGDFSYFVRISMASNETK